MAGGVRQSMDWLVGLVNPKDWLIPKIDCNIYNYKLYSYYLVIFYLR